MRSADQHDTAAHHHPEAATIVNSVAADAKSVADGQKLFNKHRTNCPGDTNGEIYVVIRDGAKGTGMKAFGSKMTAHELWDVVNDVRSIGPRRAGWVAWVRWVA